MEPVSDPTPSSNMPVPSRASRLRDLVVLGYSHAGQHAYVAGVGIAIPFVIATFHVSYAEVGLLLAVATMTGSLLQIMAGIVSRISSRVLLFLQNLGSTVGAILGAAAPGIGVFFAGRLVQAWSTWPQHPIGAAFLSRHHPDRRGSVLSWHVTAGNIGTLVAPLAMASVIAAGGWRWGFVFLVALLASTALVVAIWMPGSWRLGPRRASSSGQAATSNSLSRSWSEFVSLVRQRPVASLLVAGMLAAGGQGIGILSVYLPSYMKSGLHFPAVALGVEMTVVYVGAVIGPVLTGSLSDRTGHRGMLLINYMLGAVGLALVPVVGSSKVVIAAIGLMVGIFSYSELSLRQTLFADYLGSGSERAGFGMFFAVSQAIGAAWVAIIGFVVTDVSFHAAFYVMAGTFIASACVVAIGTRSSRSQPAAS